MKASKWGQVRLSKSVSVYAPKPVAQEIRRLINKAGEKVSVGFPPRSKENREPTSSLRVREKQYAGDFFQMSRELLTDPDYVLADDSVKARAFNNLAQYLRERTRKNVADLTANDIIQRAANAAARKQEREIYQGVLR